MSKKKESECGVLCNGRRQGVLSFLGWLEIIMGFMAWSPGEALKRHVMEVTL